MGSLSVHRLSQMGTTYLVVNATKRQFFDPSYVGGNENSKRSGILWGLSGHGLAQLLLPQNDLEFHLESWIGDSLFLAGDETNTIEFLAQLDPNPNEDASYIVIHNFDNITLNLIAFLCRRRSILDSFLELSENDGLVFINLAHIILYLRTKHIEVPFVERYGTNWRTRYVAELKAHAWHHTLPMTPDTKQIIVPHVLKPSSVLKKGGR